MVFRRELPTTDPNAWTTNLGLVQAPTTEFHDTTAVPLVHYEYKVEAIGVCDWGGSNNVDEGWRSK
jgi:hypothetical protein